MTPNNNKNEYPKKVQDAETIAKRSVHRKQKERNLRKKRKKVNRLKAFLRFIIFILLLFLIYEFWTLPQWYLKKDAFSKPDGQTVEIINNKIVPTKIIYDVLKDVKIYNMPIFMMSVMPIKREIFKIPVIKRIYVRRYGFPARIQIIVRERIPVAVIKTNLKDKPVAFITLDGILVTNRNYMGLAESTSTIKILAKNPKFDGKDWTVKRVEELEKIAKAVETYSSEKVHYIDVRNPNDVFVRIDTTNVRLGVLDSTVYDRIKRIYTILPQIDEVDGQIKYIDLSWDKVNYIKLKETESVGE